MFPHVSKYSEMDGCDHGPALVVKVMSVKSMADWVSASPPTATRISRFLNEREAQKGLPSFVPDKAPFDGPLPHRATRESFCGAPPAMRIAQETDGDQRLGSGAMAAFNAMCRDGLYPASISRS